VLGTIGRGAKGSEGGAIGASVLVRGDAFGRGAVNLGACDQSVRVHVENIATVGWCVGEASYLVFLDPKRTIEIHNYIIYC